MFARSIVLSFFVCVDFFRGWTLAFWSISQIFLLKLNGWEFENVFVCITFLWTLISKVSPVLWIKISKNSSLFFKCKIWPQIFRFLIRSQLNTRLVETIKIHLLFTHFYAMFSGITISECRCFLTNENGFNKNELRKNNQEIDTYKLSFHCWFPKKHTYKYVPLILKNIRSIIYTDLSEIDVHPPPPY